MKYLDQNNYSLASLFQTSVATPRFNVKLTVDGIVPSFLFITLKERTVMQAEETRKKNAMEIRISCEGILRIQAVRNKTGDFK